MTTITVLRPTPVQPPPAAAWAARGFVHLFRWLQGAARSRAAQQRVITRSTEAAAVRAYARELEMRDPRFAADLLAAADRHENGL